jgi:hypothetical protein
MKKLSKQALKKLKGGGGTTTFSYFCPTYFACSYYDDETGQIAQATCEQRAAVNIVLPGGNILVGEGGCFCGNSPYHCFNEE